MLFLKSIIMAIWKGVILGVHISTTIMIVCATLAFVLFFFVTVGNYCVKLSNPDRKAYKSAPKEPKVSKIMKTNKWNLN